MEWGSRFTQRRQDIRDIEEWKVALKCNLS